MDYDVRFTHPFTKSKFVHNSLHNNGYNYNTQIFSPNLTWQCFYSIIFKMFVSTWTCRPTNHTTLKGQCVNTWPSTCVSCLSSPAGDSGSLCQRDIDTGGELCWITFCLRDTWCSATWQRKLTSAASISKDFIWLFMLSQIWQNFLHTAGHLYSNRRHRQTQLMCTTLCLL